MSRLIYGNPGSQVEIAYIRTRAIDRAPQYSDDGVEYLYTKVTLGVAGVVNAASGLTPSLPGESTVQTMQRIQHYLETPRQALQFIVGPDVYLNVVPPDVKWGPFPRKFSINQIGGTQTFLVDYTIEAYVVECPGGTVPAPYLSHRFQTTQSIDEKFYSKLTTTGKIITRSDINASPDALRGVIAPPIPDWFKRISSDYTLAEDGLSLSYSYVDQEQYLQPPYPAVKAAGRYRESTNIGGYREAHVSVRLEGAATSPKLDLIALAILIGTAKIYGGAAFIPVPQPGVEQNPQPPIFKMAVIEEDLYENNIEVQIQAIIGLTKARKGNLAADLYSFAVSLPGSEQSAPTSDPGTRGTAAIQLIAAALHDPCLAGTELRGFGPGQNVAVGTAPTGASLTFRIAGTTPRVDDEGAALVSAGIVPGISTDYKISHHYETPQYTKALPLASSNNLNGKATAFVQLAAPNTRLVVDFEGEASAAEPVLPHVPTDPNMVLLHVDLKPAGTDLRADGISTEKKVRGRYIFGFRDETKVQVQHGVPPWMDQTQVQASLTPDDFASGIIDAGATEPQQAILQAGGPAGPQGGNQLNAGGQQGN